MTFPFVPLKGFSSISNSTLSNQIQDNIVEYFDYGLLDKGNYFNVTLAESSTDGHDYSRLRLSSNDAYTSGRVWEGFRKNWVWQSGISGVGMAPAIVGVNPNFPGLSGVYVNDVLEPSSGVGQYSHFIDYFNGRVIFDSPIPTGSKVQAEFSYKYINVVYANNAPWFREIQKNTTEPTANFLGVSQGSWDVPPETRLQLPAIAVEVVPMRKFEGYQLGGGQWVYSDVLFHCIAEDEYTRNQLIDMVSNQNDKTIYLFDNNTIDQSGAFPLDNNGTPVPSALLYPDLIDLYSGGGTMRITKALVQDMRMIQSDVFGGVVRVTTELIKTNI